MGNSALEIIADDIAAGLMQEMHIANGDDPAGYGNIVELLLQRLSKNVVALMKDVDSGEIDHDETTEARLWKAEQKLQKLLTGDGDGDEDEVEGNGSHLPNLKYARPKYKNIESVLKYVDRDEDTGGVKLVIMNFND